MMQSLEQLGEMIRRQQELMDKTYRADRGDAQNGDGKPMTRGGAGAGAAASSRRASRACRASSRS